MAAALTAFAAIGTAAPVPPAAAAGRLASNARRMEDDALEKIASDAMRRLVAMSPLPGPEPDLLFSDDALSGAITAQNAITVSRKLLRLCATAPSGAPRPSGARDALIAFVLAHELAHFTRGDAGSFGARDATAALEMDADGRAVRLLFVSGIDFQPLDVAHLLRAIARERQYRQPSNVHLDRARAIRKAIRDAHESAAERFVGWLLMVSGRFDQAIAFNGAVAAVYPYPEPMYALAVTRLHAAWRLSPCDDPALLEWLPPLRLDPRSQVEPFTVRSAKGPCDALRSEIETAARVLVKVPSIPAAQVALASIRLMQADQPTIDPTAKIGGVPRIGDACAENWRGASDVAVDACHVSLLSAYELSRRAPGARDVAIAGLEELHKRSPDDPALLFNLARLLTHAHREKEAIPLWRAFLGSTAPGPYRKEAEVSLSRMPTDLLPVLPAPSTEQASTPAPAPEPPLAAMLPPCADRKAWRAVRVASSSSWSRCGDWNGETVVARGRDVVIRSVAAGTAAWPAAEPPSTPPLFVTTAPGGEELRVWEQEAWVLAEKTPRRVVYFTKPQ